MNKEFNSPNEIIQAFCGEYPSDFEDKDYQVIQTLFFKMILLMKL